ncbi:MAG: hypothetical protein RL272_445 [Candidatus Parcubacteria bacterium]
MPNLSRPLVLFAAIALSALAGCATTIRTPFGTTYSYDGTTTYTPAPQAPVYHHSESFPGYYCEVYSIGTGDAMQFTRQCYSNR